MTVQYQRHRSHQAVVMLSDDEDAHCKEEADLLGGSRAAYIRMLIRQDMRKQGKKLEQK